MQNISASTGLNNTSSLYTKDLSSKAEGIAWCTAFALEAVFIIAGNLLTIVLFAVNKKLRKKVLFLVINMAFADLLIGCVAIPFHVYLRLGRTYELWTTARSHTTLSGIYDIIRGIVFRASLISAALISCERFYAIYWPLKHRTLSTQAYGIVILGGWTLSIIVSTFVILASVGFLLRKFASYATVSFYLIFLFIVCGCNIGIWAKFKRGRIASQQQNRASQNQHLTKTLLFVSTVALLSWLPLIILTYLRLRRNFSAAIFVSYSNSFLNVIMYAIRIAEFRQELASCCFRWQIVQNMESNERDHRVLRATPVTQRRTLPVDPIRPQLVCKQQFIDTKL